MTPLAMRRCKLWYSGVCLTDSEGIKWNLIAVFVKQLSSWVSDAGCGMLSGGWSLGAVSRGGRHRPSARPTIAETKPVL